LRVSSGEAALPILNREDVDLILLDVRLPGISGFEVLRIVKEYYSLIEVSTQDQIGLLFAITNSLYRQGCLIHLAKISTVLHHVFDVFYVTDVEGRKIEDWRHMQAICEGVRQRLEAGPAAE